jgi:hypothetical protein
MTKKHLLPFASLFLCAILYLVWPLAHTIALRKVLLLISAVVGITIWVKSEDRYEIIKTPWLILLGLLLIWVVFHVIFISQNGDEAWQELLGQWIPAYLALLAGIGLALAGRSIDPFVFRVYLLLVLTAQPVLFLLVSVYKSMQIGHLATGFYIGMLGTDLKASLTFSSNMLAALACAKIIESNKDGIYKFVWLLPIALAIFVAIVSASLNSILLISACIVFTVALLAYRYKNKFLHYSLFLLICITVMLIYVTSFFTTTFDLGWQRMISNTKVAVNIDKYTNWINIYKLDLPSNEMGERVPGSYYLRVAYATAGLRAVLEYPLGYGVTRHAFERLIQKKYPDASIANAHNGYINLSCAVGIPGLLLFVLAIFVLFMQLRNSRSELAHPVIWVIGINALNWVLDPLERDHFFESYLFVIGLLLTLTISRIPQKIVHNNVEKLVTY